MTEANVSETEGDQMSHMDLNKFLDSIRELTIQEGRQCIGCRDIKNPMPSSIGFGMQSSGKEEWRVQSWSWSDQCKGWLEIHVSNDKSLYLCEKCRESARVVVGNVSVGVGAPANA